ncbi:glycerol-1-phosphate dehydrogenase [Methanobrevibacter cuticularis]|uniref:Glycerol-1-phosphate dehydrogenase [NAD(P)+] n=1 Tax=Methanobrevibacter cuticularis TaxID=47311 RepID=A0A166E0K4_9EURY|nr:NAD(P)-dependent glycerol-1-phosphate dehydrogenase [Methanobrevibacter cuticularis]KZX16148.1 glycerol-1-phosphate dehydrogenase [Methanobrevibacter cuticularis]
MNYKKIQMPREVHIGSDVINETGKICQDLKIDGNLLVVTGKNTLKIGAKIAIESLEELNYSVDLVQITEASQNAIKKVEDKSSDVSLILGVGGGKIIDVAKMAAKNKDTYFMSVPTAASHDGIASPLASIKDAKGSVSLTAQSPIGVIADTNIIRNAPFRLLASGCADIVSNYTAIKDWQLAQRLQNEGYSESAAALSLMTAKLIIKSSNSIKEGLEESARLVVKSLFSSGMAISIAGSSRPASGSEHKFSHALDRIAKKPALHGEQCGIGAIMMMNLHGGDWKFIRNALKDMKAPTNAYELEIDPDDIIEALISAHKIRPERYTILGDRGLSRDAAKKLAVKTGVI